MNKVASIVSDGPTLMPIPVFYFVLIHEGRWTVRFDHCEIVESYPDKTSAIDAARTMALVRWQDYGKSGGVRIQDVTGWVDDVAFGVD